MALSPLNVLPQRNPDERLPEALAIMLPQHQDNATSFENGAKKVEQDDGSVVIDFDPQGSKTPSKKFDANLALHMEDDKLAQVCSDLLRGFQSDNDSRQEQLDTLAEGMKLLGLTIESTQSSPGASSSTGVEGQHKTTHPLLLDACLLFQANARGQLLPAAGPVKVRDDQTQQPPAPPLPPPLPPAAASPLGGGPMPPMAPPGPNVVPAGMPPGAPPRNPFGPAPSAPMSPAGPMGGMPHPSSAPGMPPLPFGMGHNGGPPMLPPGMEPPKTDRDILAQALEKDFNHYLTVTASEYVPDTDQMLFKTGFGGLGIKKVYNCPIRRRPVSESVNVEDLVVSNALATLGNAGRITHVTKMRPSTLRRLQLLKFYRDIPIGTPTQSDQPTAVDQTKADIQGVQPQVQDPKDADHVILEILCELELDEFAPTHFKGKGLPLPYRVTIEKDAQKVLEIRRNWREDDRQCLAKEYYVEYVFVRAFGFYGLGLLHILGNTTKTLTAAWREFIDSGMFANFPGFLYAKGAGRQLTNTFRVAPGTGVGLDIGLQKLSDAVMPLPYKDLGPAFTAFIQHVEELGQRLGGTAQLNVGEGRQDAPVGTTIALIEQATKPTGAVMKRLHTAQSKEFQLIKERFQEDPEAFWRFNRKPAMPWQKQQFLQAIDDFDLVPVADPNNPTALHRAAKAAWLEQIAMTGILDPKKTFLRAAKYHEIDDPEGLWPAAPQGPPQGPPPDPHKMAEVQLKAQSMQQKAQSEAQKAAMGAQETQLQLADKVAERQSKEKIAMLELQVERLRLASTLAIHSNEAESAQKALHMQIAGQELNDIRDYHRENFNRQHETAMTIAEKQHEAAERERDRQHERELADKQAAATRSKGVQ